MRGTPNLDMFKFFINANEFTACNCLLLTYKEFISPLFLLFKNSFISYQTEPINNTATPNIRKLFHMLIVLTTNRYGQIKLSIS